jgi:hypothetical protein
LTVISEETQKMLRAFDTFESDKISTEKSLEIEKKKTESESLFGIHFYLFHQRFDDALKNVHKVSSENSITRHFSPTHFKFLLRRKNGRTDY